MYVTHFCCCKNKAISTFITISHTSHKKNKKKKKQNKNKSLFTHSHWHQCTPHWIHTPRKRKIHCTFVNWLNWHAIISAQHGSSDTREFSIFFFYHTIIILLYTFCDVCAPFILLALISFRLCLVKNVESFSLYTI